MPNTTKFVKKVDIQTSIEPDHNTILLLLSWPDEHPRGPGFWKFNNTLTGDEEYVAKIRELYPKLREKFLYVNDPQLFWELMIMELRSVTISFAKGKVKTVKNREAVTKEQLDELDKIICNSQNLDNIDTVLLACSMRILKRNFSCSMITRVELLCSGPSAVGLKKEKRLLNISLT